jgi:antitoxin HicB
MAKTPITHPRPHRGSSFDDFLKEDGVFEDVQARVFKRVLAEQFDDAMLPNKPSKVATAQQLQLDK